MLTSKEAAARLGITPQRVTQLIAEGKLSAQRLGSQWIIDEESVQKRLQTVRPKGGRPRAGHARNEAKFLLMNRTHPICQVIYNRDRAEFTRIGPIMDRDRAPLGVFQRRTSHVVTFNAWWRGRGIPQTRSNLQRILDNAQANVPEELIMRNLGLSLSDQYWINPDNAGLAWEDVNFFNHDFSHVLSETETSTSETTLAGAHPDNTSDGNLSKTWVVRDGIRVLLKEGGRLCQEPYNELVATALYRRLLAAKDYVPYTLKGSGFHALCACPNFLTDEEEFIPALYVDRTLPERHDQNSYQHYVSCCKELGIGNIEPSLWKMIVCDDIIANSDRHYRNFGIVRNVNTLECRPAPIFDSGSCLWFDCSLDDLRKGESSFSSKQFYSSPARQLLLVEDMTWFEPKDLEGFVDEAMGILAQNPLLEERLPFIRRSLARRVNRIVDIREWG